MRCVGTVVRGIRTPIIKKDDDLATIVVDSLMAAKESEGFEFRDKDIVAITEAVVGISEGNYVTVDDVAKDLQEKFPSKNIGVVNPILSRNRFSIILKGIARGMDKITLLSSFPSDEVGNGIMDESILDKSEFDLASVISEDEYKETFGSWIHPFTGINMVDFYRDLIESEDCEVEFVFSNNIRTILDYTNDVLTCDIHTREKSTALLKGEGANVYGLHQVLTEPVDGSGCNPEYGLLGSNKATEEKLKLFPKTGQAVVEEVQKRLIELTGKQIEVMVYGDGAFKDPVGKIWELAEAIVDEIRKKAENLMGQMITEGTTPRVLTDLIGSLCDLTSGSGDKGTPVVFIQGYFDNLASD